MFDDVEKDKPLFVSPLDLLNSIYHNYGENYYRNTVGYLNQMIRQMLENKEDIGGYNFYVVKNSDLESEFSIITVVKSAPLNGVIISISETIGEKDGVISLYTDMKELKDIVYVSDEEGNIIVH